MLPKFCFPYDVERVTPNPMVQHFTFVLTDLEGNRRFGFCRLAGGALSCLCILSYLPWFEVFYKLLNNVGDLLAKGQVSEAEELLSALYLHPVPGPHSPMGLELDQQHSKLKITSRSCPLPQGPGESQTVRGSQGGANQWDEGGREKGRREGRREGGRREEGRGEAVCAVVSCLLSPAPHQLSYFIAPDANSLPSIPESRNLTELVVAMTPENILHLYSSLLCERRILLTASKLSTLTACIHASASLLYPMQWQHVYIPTLPPHLLDYCW
uniref:UDENN domain-containing protein n=1 Tax=Ornithorhynchus anatinus TaxID=9258 RepID=F6VW57_ORNAN